MKHIYIARHAEAVPIGMAGIYHDFDRTLTPVGEALLERQALGLQRLAPQMDLCIASPLVRTRQTAAILTAPYACPIETSEALGSHPNLQQVGDLLAATEARQILLVTHQPFVVQLVSWLLTGDDELSCEYSPGTLAALRLFQCEPQPRGELRWLMPPELLAAQADASFTP